MELGDIRSTILQTPLVKSLPEAMQPRFVMMLLWVSETKVTSRGDTLFLKGERETHHGCLILQGMVEIKKGEEKVGTFVEAPDILGEMQLFTPDGQRTATVEVAVGGQMLVFEWTQLGKAARESYNAEEMATLKNAIMKFAWKRDTSLFEKMP